MCITPTVTLSLAWEQPFFECILGLSGNHVVLELTYSPQTAYPVTLSLPEQDETAKTIQKQLA